MYISYIFASLVFVLGVAAVVLLGVREHRPRSSLDAIDEPCEAAAAMMVAAAQVDGRLTEAGRAAVTTGLIKAFGVSRRQANKLLERSCPLVEGRSAGEVFRQLTPFLLAKCGPTEHVDLLDMLREVARARGRTDEALAQDIARLAYDLESA